jgi:hypothetical protein
VVDVATISTLLPQKHTYEKPKIRVKEGPNTLYCLFEIPHDAVTRLPPVAIGPASSRTEGGNTLWQRTAMPCSRAVFGYGATDQLTRSNPYQWSWKHLFPSVLEHKLDNSHFKHLDILISHRINLPCSGTVLRLLYQGSHSYG